MDIQIKCTWAKGDSSFNKFEDVFRWLSNLKGLGKGSLGSVLYQLAKQGSYESCMRSNFKVESTFADYFVVERIAAETKLRKSRVGGYVTSRNRDIALAFAKELDSYIAHQLPVQKVHPEVERT